MYAQTENILSEFYLKSFFVPASLWRALLQIFIIVSFSPRQNQNVMKALPLLEFENLFFCTLNYGEIYLSVYWVIRGNSINQLCSRVSFGGGERRSYCIKPKYLSWSGEEIIFSVNTDEICVFSSHSNSWRLSQDNGYLVRQQQQQLRWLNA